MWVMGVKGIILYYLKSHLQNLTKRVFKVIPYLDLTVHGDAAMPRAHYPRDHLSVRACTRISYSQRHTCTVWTFKSLKSSGYRWRFSVACKSNLRCKSSYN
ncbi:uncharacterized protein [Physcomitrium patens]|uniref:uncharacterized protein isoform X5 n=1 Tax=Physcomitrium patens TaxID=3218 RepID=UPI000D16884D|nr:uncharacterized protein LOC112279425 isoform X2 [Physcomitrium patens]|eukprot:XP_024369609.1 uncharacterized protein LOC112279425 isoform X2 [Physcomitrella patens]